MRIALIAPLVSPIAQPYIGGAQALLAALATGLSQRGHAITLFARSGSQLEGIQIESISVPMEVRPATFSQPAAVATADPGFFAQANLFLELFLQLQRRSHEFDLVHAHAFDWPAYTCSALLKELPVLHTLHLPAVAPEINQALRILDQQGHPLTLITVSRSCARTYASVTPIDHIVHNGLAITDIPFQAQVPSDAPLLFAGRISPEKGVEEAIDIAEKTDTPLVMVGGIYDQSYYDQKIAPRIAAARARITYLGQIKREEVWRHMSQAKGLLCPINWDEPFGLTTIEAMATGTPVIAFRRGAMAEIIQHGKTGFLAEPGNYEQAAALVQQLDTIRRADCRAYIAETFSIEQMIGAYEQIYQNTMHQRKSTH
jgi:UDP-glucose:tetrahydrobiopterin glucosyltransferase